MNAKQCACAQRTARAHIVCAIAVLFFSPAFANGQIRTVALTGQPAPGRPDNFFSIATAPVVINDAGQVAFSAEFDANSGRRAMFSEGSGSLALVAGPGLPAPGFPDGTTFFSADGGYVNNSGGAVIKGLVLAPTFIRGFWAIESGVLELVAKGGMQAPGLPAGDNFLDGLIAAEFAFNDVGETLFFSTITGPGVDFTNSEGLWSGHPGSLTLLARTGSKRRERRAASCSAIWGDPT